MTFTSARFAAVVALSALALAGCEEFEGSSDPDAAEASAAAALGPDGPRTEVRDVERPDVFSVSENGLWDGRPSLGGIWVAHPDVTQPERAKVTNASTGSSIEAALFRRERANPGPRIQVSSDAATALGMLAGQPVELTIVAVRREEIELAPAALPLSDETDAPDGAADDDGAAVAAAAAAVIADGADGAAATVAEPPRRQGFWGRFRDSLRNKPKDDAATAGAALAATTAESAAAPDVETETLDPVTTAAAAAIDQAEDTTEAAAPPASGVRNPYIQVGLFSEEENASAVAANLRQAGIVPQIRGQKSGDKTLWRVFIGPVSNADDQAELLGQVKRLGYTDAFLAPS